LSIRIYALAKQLKRESKELVDVCKKLGISGKVNPLSSLSEDEAKKISDYFAKDKAPSSARSFVENAEKTVTMQRPPILSTPSGKVPVLQPARPSRLAELNKSGEFIKSKVAEDEQNDKSEVAETKPEENTPEESNVPQKDAASVEASSVVSESLDKVVEVAVVENSSPEQATSGASENVVQTVDSVNSGESEQIQEKVCEVPTVSSDEEKAPANHGVASEEESNATEVREAFVSAEEQKMESESKDEEVSSTKEAENKVPEIAGIVSDAFGQDAGKSGDVGSSEVSVPSSSVASTPTVQPVAEVPKANTLPPRETTSNAGFAARKAQSELSGAKKTPLRDALDRRDGQRDFRRSHDKDGFRGKGGRNEIKPTRPVPPIIAQQQESRAQILDEMKRPPMITPPHGDKLRVFDVSRKKKDDASASNGSQRPVSVRPSVALHLAPMPTQVPKSAKKTAKEPVAQKPEMRLPPEALRAAAHGVMGPLTEHIRRVEEGARQQSAESSGKNRDRDRKGGAVAKDRDAQRTSREERGRSPRGGDVKMNDSNFGGMNESGSSGKRGKKSSSRDHDVEGREDVRSSSRRRQGNEARRFHDDDSDYRPSSHVGRSRKDKGVPSTVTAPRKGDVTIETPCTVKQFAETTGISVATVIKKLMELGYMLTLNQSLDREVIELLIVALDLKATIKSEATLEEKYVEPLIRQEDAPEDLVPRAPVVTFLGHVDHGKTSLLDRILHLHVVSGEKGGITQHIRAYRVTTPGGAVTFVDTPGHEAFTEMRARGANCTDVAVLVVAADDGVMPQTEEAISHAKAAGVPIVVALNKMDLPGVNRDKVIQELASNDLMPSEWGGDVEIVETSAVTGMGVDNLLDTLLTVAELNELKANPNRPANGVVLEASLQSGEGVVCKALVQNGTLRNGDVVLCGSSYGRVRSMTDTLDSHKRIKEAGPSVPVSLVGLDVPPDAGSKFVVLEDVSAARQIAEERAKRAREVELAGAPAHVTLENLFERLNSTKTQQALNVVIRADVRGSIEAIRKELGKLDHPEVKVKILQASVGGITEADVHLADASDAIIVGFNVVPDEGARALAETKKVQVRRYDVIYKLTEDIRAALEGMLKPIEQVKELGRALVQRAFNISRVGVIAGCRVLYGVIERDCQIRVIRDSRVIGEYQLETLKREKDDVKEVRDGYECGMKLKNFNDVKEGDVLEAYKIEEIARTLE